MRQIAALLFSIAVLSGCSNPGIVKLSPDTYMLSREDHAGVFGSASSLKAEVIGDANAFAEEQGKVAIPLSSKEKPMGFCCGQWASFEYQFRVVDKNDPEVRRTSLVPRADVVIEKTEHISGNIHTIDESKKPMDMYGELVKLDDLRKKGIITDEEFEAQKKKILSEK